MRKLKIMLILIIEDDPDTQANLADILALDGHVVEVADSITTALDRTDWNRFAAILLDRRLSDGNTDELLPQLRRLAPRAGIIVMTGYVDLDNTIHALRHGAADYILKPINPDALRLSISRLQQLRDAEDRILQSERLAAIGQVAAGIAHESRNALQRIQAAVEMLQLDISDRPDQVQVLRRIERAADDIGALLDEVRNYAGPIVLERKTFELCDAWRSAWDHVLSARSAEGKFHEQLECDELTMIGDPFRLEQVFRNVFENSLSACTEGNTGTSAKIDLSCRRVSAGGAPAFQIVIRDNGVGFSDEAREKAFDPFFSTKTKGTGLGMPICRRIVEAHGGRMTISENVAGGAEIVCTLPQVALDVPPAWETGGAGRLQPSG